MPLRRFQTIFVLVAGIWSALAGAEGTLAEWPQFRGSHGGISAERAPTHWDDLRNIRWRRRLPGIGCSSPIVAGGRVYVTCYSGYDTPDAGSASAAKLQRHILCIDRTTGFTDWMRTVDAAGNEDPYANFLTDHGYATNTPYVDDTGVYVFWGKGGIAAYGLDGELRWLRSVGAESNPEQFGSGASLTAFDDLIIVNACDEIQSLVAFEKRTGRRAWTSAASKLDGTYATPVLFARSDGSTDLIIVVPTEIWGLDPRTGGMRWHLPCITGKYITATPVASNETVVTTTGAIAALSFRKDESNPTLAWRRNSGFGIPSPVIRDGMLYGVNTFGIVYCIDLSDGRVVKRRRITDSRSSPKVYSSPVVADEMLYVVTQTSGTFVFSADAELRQTAHNQLDHDGGVFKATPAISDGQIFLRSDRYLYCIEEGAERNPEPGEGAVPQQQDSFAKFLEPTFLLNFIKNGAVDFLGAEGPDGLSDGERLLMFDEDNDGLVEAQELEGLPELVANTVFALADANHDGVIDEAERAELTKAADSHRAAHPSRRRERQTPLPERPSKAASP